MRHVVNRRVATGSLRELASRLSYSQKLTLQYDKHYRRIATGIARVGYIGLHKAAFQLITDYVIGC